MWHYVLNSITDLGVNSVASVYSLACAALSGTITLNICFDIIETKYHYMVWPFDIVCMSERNVWQMGLCQKQHNFGEDSCTICQNQYVQAFHVYIHIEP